MLGHIIHLIDMYDMYTWYYVIVLTITAMPLRSAPVLADVGILLGTVVVEFSTICILSDDIPSVSLATYK